MRISPTPITPEQHTSAPAAQPPAMPLDAFAASLIERLDADQDGRVRARGRHLETGFVQITGAGNQLHRSGLVDLLPAAHPDLLGIADVQAAIDVFDLDRDGALSDTEHALAAAGTAMTLVDTSPIWNGIPPGWAGYPRRRHSR